MTAPREDDREAPTDVGADTQRFRVFFEREEREEATSRHGFRLVTLAVSLAIFVLTVWLLLR